MSLWKYGVYLLFLIEKGKKKEGIEVKDENKLHFFNAFARSVGLA